MRFLSVISGFGGLILATALAVLLFPGSAPPNRLLPKPVPIPDTMKPSPPPFSANDVGQRIKALADSGEPVVVHITVALCDNVHQGIVPVPKKIGNGQDPTNNLYWGAAYGVRSYMTGTAGYKIVRRDTLADQGILERVVLYKQIQRSGKNLDLYLIADAWDGSKIAQAIWRFLGHAAGYLPEELETTVPGKNGSTRIIRGGGSSVMVVFVGHNGLMDFDFEETVAANPEGPPRSSVVLACASRPYFLEILQKGGSCPLLLTTHLMAPEAYSLEAGIASFVKGESLKQLHENVATAYNKYQKCGMKGARKLFAVAAE